MLNQVVIAGNLGNDPEVFYGNQGDQVVSFDLAFHSGKDRTGWIKVVAFNKLAETVEKYLHKGARVAVVGNLDQRKWQAQDGSQRSSYQIVAHSVEFIKLNNADHAASDEAGTAEREKNDVPY